MKILFDHQIFDLQQYGGISRYFSELMRHFAASCSPEFNLASPYTTNSYLWEAPFLHLNTPFTRRRFKGCGAVNNFLAGRRNRLASETALSAGDFDLFHPTYYDPYFLDHLGEKPFVLTVHDMTHERFPECYPEDDQTSAWKKQLVSRADHIIAVSQSSRSDLIRMLGISEEKVTVVGHGSSLSLSSLMPVNGLPEKYLLFIGERGRYKNFFFAMKALTPLIKADRNLFLLAVGGGAFTVGERIFMDSVGISDKCLHMALVENELAAAYANALAMIFPSLCEGFGIPVLEAFACGCPAILSNRTSLPEVGGDAVLYFDPENGDNLLQQVSALIADSSLREYLVAAGLKRSKEFSWQKCALETAAVYEKVLGAGR